MIFRLAAVAEAISWTGLLVGMFFKHAIHAGDRGVAIFGPIHGILFLTYIAAVVLNARVRTWNGKVTLLALAAAVPPLTTVAFERWASREGLLDQDAKGPATRS